MSESQTLGEPLEANGQGSGGGEPLEARADAYAVAALLLSVAALVAGYWLLFDSLWSQNTPFAKAALCCASAGFPVLLLFSLMAVPSLVFNFCLRCREDLDEAELL